MSLIAPILFLLATIGAIYSCAKVLWHAVGMFRGTRSSAEPWVNLLPFVALAHPSALDAPGQAHRAKFVAWTGITALFAIVAVVVRQVAGP